MSGEHGVILLYQIDCKLMQPARNILSESGLWCPGATTIGSKIGELLVFAVGLRDNLERHAAPVAP
jgi:hypothetical protein